MDLLKGLISKSTSDISAHLIIAAEFPLLQGKVSRFYSIFAVVFEISHASHKLLDLSNYFISVVQHNSKPPIVGLFIQQTIPHSLRTRISSIKQSFDASHVREEGGRYTAYLEVCNYLMHYLV